MYIGVINNELLHGPLIKPIRQMYSWCT